MKNLDNIPKEFYSFETKQPFENCIQCNCDLLIEGRQYIIERSIKKYPGTTAIDVIYEYAMCMSCALEQKKSISKESLQNIEKYFHENVSMEKAQQSFSTEVDEQHCAIHGTPIGQMGEFVLQASCNGTNLEPGVRPMIFGQQAISEMEGLISAKTRDEMDDFIDTHFSGPPEWRELLRNKPLLI